ncbi:nucleoside monophosphate kinase [Bacteriovoracales bacterium]|nr:nucleoside monophosphate kinase [Bacteriovoracales bacterium]
MHLILLGAPGSGKGTQASRIVSELGYLHVSTGDLLRNEIRKESELGKRVSAVINSGQLVDDSLVLELLKANCTLEDNVYIFDGFPRNIEQAKALDNKVLTGHQSKAIYFKLDLGLLTERLVNRRMCKDCGAIYNLVSKAPKKSGVCDNCNSSNLYQRPDDHEDTVKNRLQVFSDTINPVLEFYEGKGDLVVVDASQGADDVFGHIKGQIQG